MSTDVKAGEKVDRRRSPQTKAKILDAAENQFVAGGYHGVSLRDISGEAGVQVALCHYHFGSKEDLFNAVIARRAEQNVGDIVASLDAVAYCENDSLQDKLEKLLRAFFAPIVEKCLRSGDGWRNYQRLMAQVSQLPQEQSFLRAVGEQSDACVSVYLSELRKLLPGLAEEDLHWCFHFYQAAITHVMAESGIVDRQSGGLCRSSDLDTILLKMAKFFAAGFAAVDQGLSD